MKSAVKKGKKKLTEIDRHNKIRVPLYGLRPWVAKENAVAFKEAMEKVRKRRKGGWPAKVWKKTVSEELVANWGGCSWGGKTPNPTARLYRRASHGVFWVSLWPIWHLA